MICVSCRDVRLHPTLLHDFSELYDRIDEAQRRGLPLIRVAECVYLDAGSSPGRKCAQSTSVVVSSCQETFQVLQELDSYHCIGLIPKGVSGKEAMKTWLPEWKLLQNGFEATVGPPGGKFQAFVYGSIALGKGDFPQAQFDGGFLNQSADHPHRSSHASRQDLGNTLFDIKASRKTLQHMREVRTEQKIHPRTATTKALLKRNGMHRETAAYESIAIDPTAQIPPIHCHAERLGMIGKMVRLTLLDLPASGRATFIGAVQRQPVPPHWDPLTTPRVSSKDPKHLMMGVMDLEHLIRLAPCALVGIMDLPPRTPVVGEHPEARAKRVTYTKEAIERLQNEATPSTLILQAFVAGARSCTNKWTVNMLLCISCSSESALCCVRLCFLISCRCILLTTHHVHILTHKLDMTRTTYT
jgi:hypothetical protein